jgi:hypothetical protein
MRSLLMGSIASACTFMFLLADDLTGTTGDWELRFYYNRSQ